MTEERPIEFWVKELDRHTTSLRSRPYSKVTTERQVPGGKQIIEEYPDQAPRLQRAANAGYAIANYLDRQQPNMSIAQRRAFYEAAIRHGEALLKLPIDKKPEVEAMVAAARTGLEIHA